MTMRTARASYVNPAAFKPIVIPYAEILKARFPLFGSNNVEAHYCPVPDKYAVWGLLLALSFITIFAVSLVPPEVEGVNVT